MEEWRELQDYPGYSVSDMGRVRNDYTGRIMVRVQNHRGFTNVGIMQDRAQVKRSVARLVAEAFVPMPLSYGPAFDTPIHLDGDRTNCSAPNLMWRPRWYAIRFHRQFERFPVWPMPPFKDVDTNEVFDDIYIPVMRYGIHLIDITKSVYNGDTVWPTMQRFTLV